MSRVDNIETVIGYYARKCNSDRFSNMDMDMTYDYSKMQMYSLYSLVRRDPRPTFLRERRNFIGVSLRGSLLCRGETKLDIMAFPTDTSL